MPGNGRVRRCTCHPSALPEAVQRTGDVRGYVGAEDCAERVQALGYPGEVSIVHHTPPSFMICGCGLLVRRGVTSVTD